LERILQIYFAMAYLNREEYIPVWLPHWLPAEVLEEIYLGILAATGQAAPVPPEEPEEAQGYIIQDWFGPFFLSPYTRSLRGRC
jgi:hypothetical protein